MSANKLLKPIYSFFQNSAFIPFFLSRNLHPSFCVSISSSSISFQTFQIRHQSPACHPSFCAATIIIFPGRETSTTASHWTETFASQIARWIVDFLNWIKMTKLSGGGGTAAQLQGEPGHCRDGWTHQLQRGAQWFTDNCIWYLFKRFSWTKQHLKLLRGLKI